MINSQDINKLRADVAENAKLWLAECRSDGLDVEVSNTLRDDEYQAYLYAQGRSRPGKIVTNGKTTTFHGAGLALDFYSKTKGWSDHNFFARCGAMAKEYGFSWAGDWKRFREFCHIQWDNHGRANHLNAPPMPKFERDEDMTQQEVRTVVEQAMEERKKPLWDKLEDVPEWGQATIKKLAACGAIGGTGSGLALNYDQLRVLVINDRAGAYGR